MKKIFINRVGEFRSGWKILSLMIIHTIITMILALTFASLPISRDTEEVIAMYGGQMVFILAVWIALKWIDKKSFKDIGLIPIKFGVRHFVWGLLLGAVLMTLIFVILLIAGEITLVNQLVSPNFTYFIWSGLLLFIIVGFAEEIVFRGYFMTALQQMNRQWVTIVVSALIFALVHGANPNASLLGLTNVFIVGLLFALMFIKTGNLWMPIGFHITWNYFQGSIFGFSVSGTNLQGIYNIDKMDNALWTGGAFGPEGGLVATIILGIGFLFVWWYPVRSTGKTSAIWRSN